MLITRRTFVTTSLAAVGSPLGRQGAAANVSSPELHFIVVGDWGQRGTQNQRSVARAMQQSASLTPARFVISVGDNFYPQGVSATSDPLWTESFESVYDAPELKCPWYAILGNHDYKGRTEAQIEYSHKSRRWKMPSAYYRLTEEITRETSVEFFFIDTTPLVSHQPAFWSFWITGSEIRRQLAWLEKSLCDSSSRWKIVVGHHPIVSSGPHGPEPALVQGVMPLLERYGVYAYFNGHEHNLQHAIANGVHYFTSGAGSEIRSPTTSCSACFAELGFMDVTISATAFVVRLMSAQGRVLHTAEVGTN